MTDERRLGHSKLVYNKVTRTINTIDPNPTAPDEPQGDIRDPIWDERNGQEPRVSDSVEERAKALVECSGWRPLYVVRWRPKNDSNEGIRHFAKAVADEEPKVATDIAAFAREVAAEAWLEGFGTGMTHPLGNAANPYLEKAKP